MKLILTTVLTPAYVIALILTALTVAAAALIGLTWLIVTAPATVYNILQQREDDRRKLTEPQGEQK